MSIRTALFFIITLIPAPLLLAAGFTGGFWVPLAFLYLTGFAMFCDEAFELDFSKGGDSWLARQALPITLSLIHFMLLPLAIYSLATLDLSVGYKILLFMAFGLFFGMISHSNAHELIHRSNRLHHRLGKWAFISMMFGHHTSAHMLVHHVHVCTPKDPNTARYNESFYSFLKRASVSEFIEGLRAENNRLGKQGLAAMNLHNPYWQYCIGAFCMVLIAYLIAGFTGVFVYICLCSYAQLQMLMIDYVQHYGLERTQLENGKYEPVSLRHSWNAPHWFSAFMTMNAPRHSDHHASPAKLYTELDGHKDTAPQLPYSLPIMAAIAFSPRRWRKIMNPRVTKWRET
ncbi:alkane 1-monooxygenase [Amylibacter sp. SFDW26]|uniref:alkane 1-monooxygenase n=1 Tax=Amylibacter sp. SFDW26 TaxID=2652722 RepID=UPI001869BB24|nr:alkane 1-monooxygenase [Amylibacter sp. SFDW26]